MSEIIRLFQFGYPIKVPDNVSKSFYFFDQIRHNHIFMITVHFLLLFCIAVFVINMIRFRRINSKILVYLSGLVVFFSAILIQSFKSSAKISNVDLSTNFLFETQNLLPKVDNKFRFLENTIRSFLLSLHESKDHLENKIGEENIIENDIRNKNNDKLDAKSKDNTIVKPNSETQGNNIENQQKSKKQRTSSEDNLKKPVSNISEQNKTINSFNNQFVTKFLDVLNSEFSQNNDFAKFLEDLNNNIKNIENETRELDANFKKFFGISENILQELKSFNANTSNYKESSINLIKTLRSLGAFNNILENLNFKNSTDFELNNIFKKTSNEHSKSEIFIDKKDEKKSKFYSYFLIFLFIQLIMGMILLFSTFVGLEYVCHLKFAVIIFLFLNLASGVYFMICAQFLDKNCILGRVTGCESNFGSGLKNFVSSANINLKSNSSNLDHVSRSLEKIQYRTEIITTTLRVIYKEDAIFDASKKIQSFKHLLDNIIFVENDFDDLTRSKVETKKYFKIIRKLKESMMKLEIYLNKIDREKFFDFYSREITFLNYIKNEKSNVILIMEDQIERNLNETESEYRRICANKKKKVCQEKYEIDKLSILLIFPTIIFLILFSI